MTEEKEGMVINKNLTFREAGQKLSNMAQLTGKHSKNWNNFAEICTSMLLQAYTSGHKDGKDKANDTGSN